jgi:hypothetical protein
MQPYAALDQANRERIRAAAVLRFPQLVARVVPIADIWRTSPNHPTRTLATIERHCRTSSRTVNPRAGKD